MLQARFLGCYGTRRNCKMISSFKTKWEDRWWVRTAFGCTMLSAHKWEIWREFMACNHQLMIQNMKFIAHYAISRHICILRNKQKHENCNFSRWNCKCVYPKAYLYMEMLSVFSISALTEISLILSWCSILWREGKETSGLLKSDTVFTGIACGNQDRLCLSIRRLIMRSWLCSLEAQESFSWGVLLVDVSC